MTDDVDDDVVDSLTARCRSSFMSDTSGVDIGNLIQLKPTSHAENNTLVLASVLLIGLLFI